MRYLSGVNSAQRVDMQSDWTVVRNHYLAMAALALFLGGLIALVDPGIGSAIAIPAAFFAAQSAGTKFAGLTGRALHRVEALRLAALGAVLQVGVGLAGIGLGMASASGSIVKIHYGAIAAILGAAAIITVLVTLAGLWFGARVVLRRARRTDIH